MAENETPTEAPQELDIKPAILEKIQRLLTHSRVSKIYFIDDAIEQDTGKETFKGIVRTILDDGKVEELKRVAIKGIDFSTDEAVLFEHIDEVWDTLKPAKQLKYFEKAYTIAGTPDAINDLNVSNNLREFFSEGQIEFLTPNGWDSRRDEILQSIEEGTKIMVIFDQDLKLASGRYSEQQIQGEQLILELKEKVDPEKVIVSLLTHTATACEQELPKRTEICAKIHTLQLADFFVLAKVRLEKPELFADGLKKVCLNTYCETIKARTIDILKEAQLETIKRIEEFDTYDFDHTVFKSSHEEGVWEPETLLRITDVIFKDEVRKLMIAKRYVPSTNPTIISAFELSNIEFDIDGTNSPYNERYKLRYQEVYEAGDLLNTLRKPIDNGDIFIITDGEKKGKRFVLVGQECDLMVRGADGKRGARTATLLEIETLSNDQLFKKMADKYKKEIERGKFKNHFFADRFKLEYFEIGTNKVGLVYFNKAITIDLNVSDLIVFNDVGEANLDLAVDGFDGRFHNDAWRKRFNLISTEFAETKAIIEKQCAAIANLEDDALKESMIVKFNHLFSFINKAGIQISYTPNRFSFGLKRIARLRFPKSKVLLDRYYQYLSRRL
ncbi:hypothetical protein [uncultured Chitinophaga sp.]|jgi:hypothetical protein|uniref:hypothetical protein n=1 Tax=uncultured Chitinophaga sp. TaxID=339340 RepID=UPI00262D6C97|nr:hypothetical protein [uncultured Chitinophaga sp.]